MPLVYFATVAMFERCGDKMTSRIGSMLQISPELCNSHECFIYLNVILESDIATLLLRQCFCHAVCLHGY